MSVPVAAAVQTASACAKESTEPLQKESPPRTVEVPGLPLRPSMSAKDGWDDQSEIEIMEQVRQGRVAAFDLLVEKLWVRSFLYSKSLGCDHERALDLTQEAFARLWERRKDWVHSGSVRVWLFRTIRHQVISDRRKWKVRMKWALRVRGEAVPDFPSPLQEIEKEEIRTAIARSVAGLSPRRREAFTLVHLQGLSYVEVAAIMDVSPRTVANHLMAAVADLRASLAAEFPSLTPEHRRTRIGDSDLPGSSQRPS
jgi:RNA polymerase sigma factor (sigma-70 family)